MSIHVNGCSGPADNRGVPGSHSVATTLENKLYAEVAISHAHPSFSTSVDMPPIPHLLARIQTPVDISVPPYSRRSVVLKGEEGSESEKIM